MTSRNQLQREIDSLPADCLEEVFDFIGFIKLKKVKSIPETMRLSEAALAKEWDTPEEDEAWAGL